MNYDLDENNYPYLNQVKYALQKDNYYNKGHYTIGKVNKGIAVKLVIGSCVLFVSLSLFSFFKSKNVEDLEKSSFMEKSYIEEEELIEQSITPILEGNENIESLDMKEESQVEPLLEVDEPNKIESLHFEEADTIIQVRQNMIRYYCQVYSVSYEKVYDKILELTNQFSNENFVQYLTIDDVKCKQNQPYASNEEELFIYAIRAMAQTPEVFGFDDSLYVESTFVSDSDFTSIIDHYAHVFQIDRRLMYAIIASETNFKSDQFLIKNNPAGIRLHGEFVKYDNLDRGMIEFCTELLKYHYLGNANTLEELRDIHAPLSDGNIYWLSNVTSIYNDLVSGAKEPFSFDSYTLWYHNGEGVYPLVVEGDQETFYGDRNLYPASWELK